MAIRNTKKKLIKLHSKILKKNLNTFHRNKEAQERENKRLLTRIANLEAELARERAFIKQEQHKTVISVTDAYDERLVNSLKMEVEKTKENADNLEKQYLQAAEDRDTALTELEEVKRRNAELEKKLEQAMSVSDHYNYRTALTNAVLLVFYTATNFQNQMPK